MLSRVRTPQRSLPAAIIVLLLWGGSLALTKSPWEDEAWFADASRTLATRGVLASEVLEGAGTFREGAARRFYWQPPGFLVACAAWGRLVGFDYWTPRALSLLWGAVALVAQFLFLQRIGLAAEAVSFGVLLTASDYFFIIGGSDGRMDMMCFALGMLALAAWTKWRVENVRRALIVAHGCVALSGVTHPSGILWFAALLLTTLFLDRERIRWSWALYAAIPYLLIGAAWGAFILADPRYFWVQFFGNIRESGASNLGSSHPLTTPLSALALELRSRYAGPFGLTGAAGMLNRLKGLILLSYVAGVIAAWRHRKETPIRLLLWLALSNFMLLTFIAGNKMSYYLIHILPLLAVLLANELGRQWRSDRRAITLAVLAVLITLQLGGIAYRIRQNGYARQYKPVVSFVLEHSAPSDLIMGSAELGYRLRPARRLVDDMRLGFHSGRSPDLIVVSAHWEAMWRLASPALSRHIGMLLARFRLAYVNPTYKVYLRTADHSGGPP